MHRSPRIRKVAVPDEKHCQRLGQAASWQTVWIPCFCRISRTSPVDRFSPVSKRSGIRIFWSFLVGLSDTLTGKRPDSGRQLFYGKGTGSVFGFRFDVLKELKSIDHKPWTKVRIAVNHVNLYIYPGSFDPFTNGHLDIVDRASRLCDRLVVAIAVNSSKQSLFTTEERRDLILSSLKGRDKVEVTFFHGLLVDYARSRKASAIVRGIRAVTDFDYEYAMYQLNHDLEQDVETVFLLASKQYSFLSSTMIKEVARYGRSVEEQAPAVVSEALLRKFGHIK